MLSADEIQQLYDRHGRALLAYACSFVSDVGAAEDVLHQVFLRLLRRDTVAPLPALGFFLRVHQIPVRRLVRVDHLLRQLVRHVVVVRELHRVAGASLRFRDEVIRVRQHLR